MTGEIRDRFAAPADVLLAVPETRTPAIQQAHQVIYHVPCEMVERDAGK